MGRTKTIERLENCDYYDAPAPNSIKESINNARQWKWEWKVGIEIGNCDWDWDWSDWLKLRLAGPVAMPGRDKMYANGLINYEISSASYVRLLKDSENPAGRSIASTPALFSLCLSFFLCGSTVGG